MMRMYLTVIAAYFVLSVVITAGARADTDSGSNEDCPELAAADLSGSVEDRAHRCALLREFSSRGLVLTSYTGGLVLTEMRRRFASTVELNGELPLPKPTVDYLLREFPDTAKLVNHFEHTRYNIFFTNPERSQFFASNGRGSEAMFNYIDQSVEFDESNYLMVESGSAKILLWRLSGNGIIELALHNNETGSAYKAKVYIFTNSHAFHTFFESALFRYLIGSMLDQILENIVSAVQQFTDAGEDFRAAHAAFSAGLAEELK